MAVAVRLAREADIDAMSTVLVASIRDLCAADHRNDAVAIARWTANKTPESIRGWLAGGPGRLFVAENSFAFPGEILCVGAYSADGKILLNYVAPGARFRGVSKHMLARLEAELRALGVAEGRLTSTATALTFYRAAGWTDAGHEAGFFPDAPATAMRKRLRPENAPATEGPLAG